MPIINLKPYLYAAGLVALIFFFMRYDYIVEKAKRQDAEISTLKANAEEAKRISDGIEQARLDANAQLEAAKNEIKKRDDCIASGACKRVVRVKSACSMPQTETASGTQEGYAELAPSVQRAAADFEYRLAEQEHQLNLCLKFAKLVSEGN